MAFISELDFAMATFWEFTKMWKNKANSRLVLTCKEGRGHVELVADLGLPGDHHVLHPLPPSPLQRRKTPAQLRRSEKRRQDFMNKKKEEAEKAPTGDVFVMTETEKFQTGQNEAAVKATEVQDAICTDEAYHSKVDVTTEEVVSKAIDEQICTVEGEFHASFPFKKFKEYVEVNLPDVVDKALDYGYWFEDEFTRFFAKLKLKSDKRKESILDMSNWPKEVKNVKLSEDYGLK